MDVSSCGCVLPNNIPVYDGVSRAGGPEGRGEARASAVLPAGNASPCSLCSCIATRLLQWKRGPHGACRSVLRPYHARKFKDDQALDKEKNVRGPAFYRADAALGYGLRRCPRHGLEGGPFCVRENGIRLLIFRGRLRHGTWLFHLYSITNIQVFSPIFLLAGSTAEACFGYSFGV